MITIYSTTTCGNCIKLKKHLKDIGVEYKEQIVGTDIKAEEFIERYNAVIS